MLSAVVIFPLPRAPRWRGSAVVLSLCCPPALALGRRRCCEGCDVVPPDHGELAFS